MLVVLGTWKGSDQSGYGTVAREKWIRYVCMDCRRLERTIWDREMVRREHVEQQDSPLLEMKAQMAQASLTDSISIMADSFPWTDISTAIA